MQEEIKQAAKSHPRSRAGREADKGTDGCASTSNGIACLPRQPSMDATLQSPLVASHPPVVTFTLFLPGRYLRTLGFRVCIIFRQRWILLAQNETLRGYKHNNHTQ